MKGLANYWRRDKARLLGLMMISIIITVTGCYTLNYKSTDIWIIVAILFVLFVLNVFHSAFLKSRRHHEDEEKYYLVTLWETNITKDKSVLYAALILLLMQFQIFYGCFLAIVWLACLFFHFEFICNDGIESFFDALYVVMISATTIGFGDIPPITTGGRIIALLSSIIGILIFGLVSASCWHAIQTTFTVFHDKK